MRIQPLVATAHVETEWAIHDAAVKLDADDSGNRPVCGINVQPYGGFINTSVLDFDVLTVPARSTARKSSASVVTTTSWRRRLKAGSLMDFSVNRTHPSHQTARKHKMKPNMLMPILCLCASALAAAPAPDPPPEIIVAISPWLPAAEWPKQQALLYHLVVADCPNGSRVIVMDDWELRVICDVPTSFCAGSKTIASTWAGCRGRFCRKRSFPRSSIRFTKASRSNWTTSTAGTGTSGRRNGACESFQRRSGKQR